MPMADLPRGDPAVRAADEFMHKLYTERPHIPDKRSRYRTSQLIFPNAVCGQRPSGRPTIPNRMLHTG